MNFNMNFPGLKGVTIERVEEQENQISLHVSLPKKEHTCPSCGASTKKVHDYRVQKIKHLKWFERLTILFYKRRRYACKYVEAVIDTASQSLQLTELAAETQAANLLSCRLLEKTGFEAAEHLERFGAKQILYKRML